MNKKKIAPIAMAAMGDNDIGYTTTIGSALLSPDENLVEFQDRDDCEYVHNAFLVVEYKEPASAEMSMGITLQPLQMQE